MKNTSALALIGNILFLLFLISPAWSQVDTRRIDEIRKKDMLDNQDLVVIDRFIREAVSDLTTTKDFAQARSVIINRAPSQEKKPQPQYAQKFTEAARASITESLQRVKQMPQERQFMVTLNLLLLISQLEDPSLTELAADYLHTEYAPIRYWAVRIVTGPVVSQQIREGQGGELGTKIVNNIKTLTKDPSPDVLELVAEFANTLGGDQGQSMLLDIASHRIEQYQKNTVQNELLEIKLLKSLAARFGPENADKTVIIRRFNDLYSQVLQRYIQKNDTLTEVQKTSLVSVIVEIEAKCIARLLNDSQASLRRAIERNDLAGLAQEYDRLLGDSGALKGLVS